MNFMGNGLIFPVRLQFFLQIGQKYLKLLLIIQNRMFNRADASLPPRVALLIYFPY